MSSGQDATIIEETQEDSDFFDENQPIGKTPGFDHILETKVSKKDPFFSEGRGTSFKFKSDAPKEPLRLTVQVPSPPSQSDTRTESGDVIEEEKKAN